MTVKFFKWPVALLVCMIAILPAGAARAQNKNDKGKKGQPITNPEDEDYKKLLAASGSTPMTQISLGEDFIMKYPMSHYLGSVYAMLTTQYSNNGQEDKMFAAGAKAIELNPDNVDMLALMAMAIPRRIKATTPDAAAQMKNAEAYGHHAIELIPTLPKPAEMDDATFEKTKNDKLSMAHSGLGLIDLNHQKYEDARTELMLAVQLSSAPDPVDYYLLGNADSAASYYNDAAAAFDKCAAAGPLMAQCKARGDVAKKDATTKLGR